MQPFLALLGVDRVSILTLGDPFEVEVLCASDPIAAHMGDTQIDLGEGPSWSAYRSQTAVIVNDVSAVQLDDWPIFRRAVVTAGTRAIFSFPMTRGTIQIGSVELHGIEPHVLSHDETAGAAALVDVVATHVLADALDAVDDADKHSPYSRREIHQATGMVIAQARVAPDDALMLIRARAFATGRSVRDIAADVVARRTDWSADDLSLE
jgi:hypothetical protein